MFLACQSTQNGSQKIFVCTISIFRHLICCHESLMNHCALMKFEKNKTKPNKTKGVNILQQNCLLDGHTVLETPTPF